MHLYTDKKFKKEERIGCHSYKKPQRKDDDIFMAG